MLCCGYRFWKPAFRPFFGECDVRDMRDIAHSHFGRPYALGAERVPAAGRPIIWRSNQIVGLRLDGCGCRVKRSRFYPRGDRQVPFSGRVAGLFCSRPMAGMACLPSRLPVSEDTARSRHPAGVHDGVPRPGDGLRKRADLFII